MDKFKIFTATLLVAGLFFGGAVQADSEFTITLEANDLECAPSGSLTPQFIDIEEGETATLTFEVPDTDPATEGLVVRGFPEGEFTLMPGDSYELTYTADGDLAYEAYLAENNCLKATGQIFLAQEFTTMDDAERDETLEAETEPEDDRQLLKIVVLSLIGVSTLTLLGSLFALVRSRR